MISPEQNNRSDIAFDVASIAQLVEHALRKRTVVGSIPTGGFISSSNFWRRLCSVISGPTARYQHTQQLCEYATAPLA